MFGLFFGILLASFYHITVCAGKTNVLTFVVRGDLVILNEANPRHLEEH